MATGETARERETVSAPAVEIRNCHGLEEFRACLELQREVWGFSDAELVPLRMFVVAAKIGGQVIGAFAGRELVGFALAVPGARGGHPYLHSHMLAVREDQRNSGLGRKIKLFQREDALARDFELIEWTFDPLEIKNAYLNLERLGAIARRYNLNQYGITSSPLQGFLPTDRLVAEWWLRSRRVESLLSSGRKPEFERLRRIPVPAQIYQWKAEEATRARAAEVQSRNREAFLRAFGEGLAVLGYERDGEGNGSFLLGRWEEKWSYAEKVPEH
jgi:predicted GNAT superfamily acetyltransferase